jgi:hypothetical protein
MSLVFIGTRPQTLMVSESSQVAQRFGVGSWGWSSRRWSRRYCWGWVILLELVLLLLFVVSNIYINKIIIRKDPYS